MFNFYILKQSSNYDIKFHKHCPIIIMGDFNVDILKDNNQPKNKRTIIFDG